MNVIQNWGKKQTENGAIFILCLFLFSAHPYVISSFLTPARGVPYRTCWSVEITHLTPTSLSFRDTGEDTKPVMTGHASIRKHLDN